MRLRCNHLLHMLQKLDKVEFGLQNEQKICESVKEKYARLIADQRQFSSLLKTFQVWTILELSFNVSKCLLAIGRRRCNKDVVEVIMC